MKVDVEKVRAQVIAGWNQVLSRWQSEDESERELMQDEIAELEELCADPIVRSDTEWLGQDELEYLSRTASALQVWMTDSLVVPDIGPLQKAG